MMAEWKWNALTQGGFDDCMKYRDALQNMGTAHSSIYNINDNSPENALKVANECVSTFKKSYSIAIDIGRKYNVELSSIETRKTEFDRDAKSILEVLI